MVIKLLKGIGISMLALMLLVGCKAKKPKVAETMSISKEEAFESITNYPIPTSFEILQLINKAGAGYIIAICNEPERLSQYLTERQKATNLGIYGADLAYATVYQMTQETMNYLNASKKLIEDLNINNGFNRELAQNVEKNINNKDSLISIITNSYFETYKNLVSDGRDNLSLMVLTGSWVEGLYITSEIAMSSQNNTDFMSIMAGQKASLGTLMQLLDKQKDNADIAALLEQLAPLHDIYSGVEGSKLNEEQFSKIVDGINKVRNSLI